MLSKRFSQLIRLFAIISLSYFLASCGDGDGPAPVYDTADPLPPSEAYTLVWSDEFDVDGAPNVKNWRIEEGYGDNGWGNNEWQLYTDDAENIRVEGGNLVINAQCSNATTDPALCNSAVRDGTITSARINTNDKFEVKYGNIQARIKVPPGKGTWPAFWMLGADFPNT
ncbi:MAG: family 16 glycosylhydrolase, partial [Gammaproteobacteria bacterium]